MTTYLSAAEILERQQRTAAADAKVTDPASITEDDLRDLSPETLTGLMDRGELAHLGIGRRRTARRR